MDELARAAELQATYGTDRMLVSFGLAVLGIVLTAAIAGLAWAVKRANSREAEAREDRRAEREERAAERAAERARNERIMAVVLDGDGNGRPGLAQIAEGMKDADKRMEAIEVALKANTEQAAETHGMMVNHLAGGPPSEVCRGYIRAEVERAIGARQ